MFRLESPNGTLLGDHFLTRESAEDARREAVQDHIRRVQCNECRKSGTHGYSVWEV